MSRAVNLLLAPLTFLGRHGTLAIALSLLVGAALPFLSATMRPFLDEAILTLLTLAFLRIGFRAVGREFRAPLPVIIATIIAMLIMPGLAFWIAQAIGFDQSHPDLYLALFIALAVPPITAVPIFASLLRLPGAIALAFLILCPRQHRSSRPCTRASSSRPRPCLLMASRLDCAWRVLWPAR